MTKKNTLVEFARFMFSLLVIGYHVQASFSVAKADFFEWGALAVEFFFILSGYFFAVSVDKFVEKDDSLFAFYGKFMTKKVKGILPVHCVAIIAAIVVLAACAPQMFEQKFVQGLPSVFLVQMFVVWDSSFSNALIVPEWYISSMLICLAIMAPIAFALRKRIKGVFVPLILVGILGVLAVIGGFAMKWNLTQNFIFDLRAWGEMCVGMFAYHVAKAVARKEYDEKGTAILKALEIVCYLVPIVVGFLPLDPNLSFVGMIVAVVCTFFAISITFAGKGIVIKNEKINSIFSFLGSISLAIYLFHPVIIQLLDYVYADVAEWTKYLIVFSSTVALAVCYKLATILIAKAINISKEKRSARSDL